MNGKNATLSRKEREREQHRKYIVDAAMRLFSEHGFHAVSMQQIAAEAEFATGTLYKFFPSKRDLFRALMVEVINGVADEIIPVFEEDCDELTLISRYLIARRTAFKRRREYVKLFNTVCNGFGFSGDEVVDELIAERRQSGKERLKNVFERGVQKGVIKPLDVELAVNMFDEFCQSVVRSECTRDDVSDESVSQLFDMFLHGIIA